MLGQITAPDNLLALGLLVFLPRESLRALLPAQFQVDTQLPRGTAAFKSNENHP